MAYYYNKKLANEIKQTQKDFIKSSPYYNKNDDFVSAQQKRFANRRSDGRHPFASGSERNLFPNPLYVGESQHFKNFEDYNDRSDDKINYNKKGGSLLYCKPELGSKKNYSSDSSSDYSSSDYSSSDDEEGAGFYDDVVKPVGRTIGNVGKEILKDVVLPIGKELLRDTIKGAVFGAGQKMKNKDFNKLLEKSKKSDNDISHILKSAKVHSKKNNVKKIIGTKRGESVRGAVVSEYMKKHGVSLGVASKKVKELGLY